MNNSMHTFTSDLQRIADFLYRAENINHEDIVYMNFTANTGVFEDRSNGSYISLEFTDEGKVLKISYILNEEKGVVSRWVKMFIDDFGATVESKD